MACSEMSTPASSSINGCRTALARKTPHALKQGSKAYTVSHTGRAPYATYRTFGSTGPVRARMAGMGGVRQSQPREPCQHRHNLAQVGQVVGTASSSFQQLGAALHCSPVADSALQACDAAWQAADMVTCWHAASSWASIGKLSWGACRRWGRERDEKIHACM